jgi:hypothetical protein
MVKSLRKSTVRHWVFVTTPDNLVVCLKHGVFGVDPSKYGIAAQSLVRVDDLFFFYVRSQRGQKTSLQDCGLTFIGPFIVKSQGSNNPNHPAVNQWTPQGKFTVIIEFKYVTNEPVGVVPVDKVLNNLLFITNKARTGRGGWQDHMQFSIISIREEDYEQLMSNRDVKHPCINQLRKLGALKI